MISYEQARDGIDRAVETLPVERVLLGEALGRVCREPVRSPECVPPWDNSAMDGFAVQARDTEKAASGAPVRLRVLSTLAAGDEPRESDGSPGTCHEIMTGAPVPAGYDSVVKVEDTESDSGFMVLKKPVPFGNNVRKAGEDFELHQAVVEPGVRLHARHLMALSALGISEIQVTKTPKVAILTTGKELVEAGNSLSPGKIRNSNGPYLSAEMQALGLRTKYFGVVRDEPKDFLRRLEDILAWEPHLVVSTGAVSVGKYDFVASSLRDLGAEILFHRVAIRPGKPILFAKLPGKPIFFGLPGNPISAAVGFRFFVEPAIRRMLGLPEEVLERGELSTGCKKPEGLKCFFKARRRVSESGQVQIEVLPGQASFMISPLLRANGWAVLRASGKRVEPGAPASFAPFTGEWT